MAPLAGTPARYTRLTDEKLKFNTFRKYRVIEIVAVLFEGVLKQGIRGAD